MNGSELVSTYLDYNATSPVKLEVIKAIAEALAITGNPSSVHQIGRAAREAVEQARDCVSVMIGARPDEVVFTAGGTEANNLALAGSSRKRLITSAIEHPSVLLAAEALAASSNHGDASAVSYPHLPLPTSDLV